MSDPEIQSIQIAGAEPGPHLLVLGGVHGDEFEPMAAIRRLSQAIKPADLRGTLTLVPVVNESAFARGQRTGEDGLDLARTFPGRADGSPTERLAERVSELIRGADYLIDLHNGSSTMDVLPLTGYMLHSNPHVLETQRQMARASNLPLVWGTTAELEGRTLSVARDANIPAIYTENHGTGRCRQAGVTAYFEGCLNVMAALQMLDRPLPPSAVTKVIEDPRPNSGHLTIGLPAPWMGFFETVLSVGDRVKKGDLLGTISDVLGERQERIHVQQTGTVLVLRTFPRVLAGENLAVILEAD